MSSYFLLELRDYDVCSPGWQVSWLWEWYVSHDRKCAGRKLRGKICQERGWRLVREVKRLLDVSCRERSEAANFITGRASLHLGSYESSHSLQNCLWKKKKTKCRSFYSLNFTFHFSVSVSVVKTLWQMFLLFPRLFPSNYQIVWSLHTSVQVVTSWILPRSAPGV